MIKMLELKNKIWKEINKITIDPFTEYDFLVEIKRVLDKYLVEKESNLELYNSLFEDATIEDAKQIMKNMFNDITPEQFEEIKKQAMENVKLNNMTAKEMFEELGYELMYNVAFDIVYYNSRYDTYIYFIKPRKHIEFTNEITVEELRAINKQVEELGWLGEDK